MQTFLKVEVTLHSPFIALIIELMNLLAKLFFPFKFVVLKDYWLFPLFEHFFSKFTLLKKPFFPKTFVNFMQKLAPKKKH
jgi:hypothetical protein